MLNFCSHSLFWLILGSKFQVDVWISRYRPFLLSMFIADSDEGASIFYIGQSLEKGKGDELQTTGGEHVNKKNIVMHRLEHNLVEQRDL